MKALTFYRHMRRGIGYSPRNAMMSTLMNFCETSDEFRRRANSVAKVLNRNDKKKFDDNEAQQAL